MYLMLGLLLSPMGVGTHTNIISACLTAGAPSCVASRDPPSTALPTLSLSCSSNALVLREETASTTAGFVSTPETWNPFSEITVAMGRPICPRPKTATLADLPLIFPSISSFDPVEATSSDIIKRPSRNWN